jgi:hypothetical protein
MSVSDGLVTERLFLSGEAVKLARLSEAIESLSRAGADAKSAL